MFKNILMYSKHVKRGNQIHVDDILYLVKFTLLTVTWGVKIRIKFNSVWISKRNLPMIEQWITGTFKATQWKQLKTENK